MATQLGPWKIWRDFCKSGDWLGRIAVADRRGNICVTHTYRDIYVFVCVIINHLTNDNFSFPSFDKLCEWIVLWQDLCSIGITTLGPRKKILHALRELKNDNDLTRTVETKTDVSKVVADETRLGTNKLITDYFSGPLFGRKRGGINTNEQNNVRRSQAELRSQQNSTHKSIKRKDRIRNGKQKDVPSWCCVPGTPFRVVIIALKSQHD